MKKDNKLDRDKFDRDLIHGILFVVFFIFMIATIYKVDKLEHIEPVVEEGYELEEYCLEWGYQYDRNTLMMLCVNFVEESLDCQWQVTEDNSMYIWTEGQENNGTMLPCTKKIPAYVKIP